MSNNPKGGVRYGATVMRLYKRGNTPGVNICRAHMAALQWTAGDWIAAGVYGDKLILRKLDVGEVVRVKGLEPAAQNRGDGNGGHDGA